jgi:hypothetical protein
MALLDDIGRGGADVLSLGLAEPLYFMPKDQKELGLQNAKDIRDAQYQAKIKELALLDQMRGPEMSPESQRRIAALEQDAAEKPLSQDPYFQGGRAQLVSGGRQALASVQNKNRAYGTGGGFSNIGSVSDIQDRLGTQLASLGEQASVRRSKAADAATQARQGFLDSQIAYENAIRQAKISIEQNDAAGAQQAINMAYKARQDAINSQRQALGQIYGTGATVAGAIMGGPAGAMAGKQVGESLAGAGGTSAGLYQQGQLDYLQPSPLSTIDRPWAYNR